jgi:hypothetical protein
MPLDRSENDRTGMSAEAEETLREPALAKERETKEDGRYIIFYSFGSEGAGEDG